MAHDTLASPLLSLPVELVQKIIATTWELPLSNKERTAFFTTSCLVNRAWLSLFIRIALTDFYITSEECGDNYLYILRGRHPSETDNDFQLVDASATINRLCRSLTFRVEGNPTIMDKGDGKPIVKFHSEDNKSADIITVVLSQIVSLSHVPNLKRLTLEYVNWGFDDIYEQGRLVRIPPGINHLDVKFSFTEEFAKFPQASPKIVRPSTKFSSTWGNTHIRTLSLSGATAFLTALLLVAFPGVRVLELTDPVKLNPHIPFPFHALRELKLRFTKSYKLEGEGGVDPLGIEALVASEEQNRFRPPFEVPRLRIVAYSDRVGDVEHLKKVCARFDVDFVLESEGSS